MASNEIIVRIAVDCAAFASGFLTTILAFKLALARSAAAHKRELAAKDDERLTIVANYENVIADKDAKIAELRECLMEAVREKCPFTRMSCRYGEQCDYECGTEKWRNALKGSNNATK